MMPFSGQGSNQAMEDAGALGAILRSLHDGEEDLTDLPTRLAQFEQVRKDRASRIQILSKIRIGKEKEVQEELKRWADPPGSSK